MAQSPIARRVCVTAAAQLLTSSVVGTIVDSSTAAIPGAKLQLVSEGTGTAREVVSDAHGNFAFNVIPSGTYSLIVELSGFKRYEKKGIELPPSERVAVEEIRLEISSVEQAPFAANDLKRGFEINGSRLFLFCKNA